MAKLERLGRERALIFKTLVLTGLRMGELASLTVEQLDLNAPMPFVVLNAADEKNRNGSTIPLRLDLANDLKDWLSDAPSVSTLRLRDHNASTVSGRRLFRVPAGLVRILNRDLATAGIDKADERGRTIDVHALRGTFATLLSKGGVAPRTAQAAMRHSTIDLTMNSYTDPKLLDVCGALDALPSLTLTDAPFPQREAAKATGTDNFRASSVTPTVTPDAGKSRLSGSFPVIASGNADRRTTRRANAENPIKPSKKALFAGFANKAFQVERKGVEPSTSALRTQRPNHTTQSLQGLVETDDFGCTNGCTNSPENEPGEVVGGSVSSRAELLPIKGDSFSAALAMIASLPLSDAEKADAVRRLMAERTLEECPE